MNAPGSPFHPTFGSSPPELAGRQQILDEIGRALDDGPGAGARGAIVTGPRGIGKTVLLNAIEDLAGERGWVAVSESVTKGLVERLLTERIPAAYELLAAPPGRQITGVTLPFGMGGVSVSPRKDERQPGLRDALDELISTVEEHGGSGVLLTLDEVHGRAGRDDLIQLTTEIQHLVRRNRNIAFAAAGLPASVEDLLNDDVTTFLRRARRFRLGSLTDPAVEEAIARPIRAAGRSITSEALADAVRATRGYPYLVQVIGDYAWKRTPPDVSEIGKPEVEWAVRHAIHDLGSQVHAPALHDLSPVDREFLRAMAEDYGPSSIGEVARRMGKTLAYTSRYRARLLAAEVIVSRGHGMVGFNLPYLADYLRSSDL